MDTEKVLVHNKPYRLKHGNKYLIEGDRGRGIAII